MRDPDLFQSHQEVRTTQVRDSDDGAPEVGASLRPSVRRPGETRWVEFVRFEASTPNEHGLRPGIFWLTNKLARSGELAPEDWAWWRAANDWYDAAYPDPGKADPTLWDAALHPDVSCWFKATATHLLERVPGYLDLLDRYGV